MTRPLFLLIFIVLLTGCSKSDDTPDTIPDPPEPKECAGTDGIPEIPGWEKREIPFSSASPSNLFPYFITENTGFLYDPNSGLLLRTADSGINWDSVGNWPYEGPLSQPFFIDDQQGFLATQTVFGSDFIITGGSFFKTTDGGITWTEHTYSPGGSIQKVFFTDDLNGFAVKLSEPNSATSPFATTLTKTNDGGKNWTAIAGVTPAMTPLNSFNILSSGFGYILGTFNRIFVTFDAGQNWEVVHTGLTGIQEVQFLDKMNGYASASPGFFRTVDGGKTWTQISENRVWFFQFFTPENGITTQSADRDSAPYASSCDAFYLTDDGGTTWVKSEASSNFASRNLFFLNENHGFSTNGVAPETFVILERE